MHAMGGRTARRGCVTSVKTKTSADFASVICHPCFRGKATSVRDKLKSKGHSQKLRDCGTPDRTVAMIAFLSFSFFPGVFGLYVFGTCKSYRFK